MPVVAPAYQFPADWLSCSTSLGVVRDGESIRIWFQPKNEAGFGAQISVETWLHEDSEIRSQFNDLVEHGAVVVAGLSPDRGLVRECSSPLGNPAKSAEVWPALLDTSLPFPLEECDVAFLPPELDPGEGTHCLAAAARTRDIEQACAEWAEMEIYPDMLIPEVLLLSDSRESSVWMGQTRCVFTAWHENHFLGAGGGAGYPPSAKAFSRFQTTWVTDIPEMTWRSVGPSADHEQSIMEQNAAKAAFLKTSCFINLLVRKDEGRLEKTLHAKHRRLWTLAGTVMLLLVAVPLFVQLALGRAGQDLQEEIGVEYFRITGEESTEPGQEVLLASRFVEESMQKIFDARRDVSGPHLTRRLLNVLTELGKANIIATAVEADPSSVVLEVLAKEPELMEVQRRLEDRGNRVELSPANQGAWRLEVTGP